MKTTIILFFGLLLVNLVISRGAFAQTTSNRVDNYSISTFIPCMSEMAVGTVTMHTVINYDKRGFISKAHYQPQCGELTGSVTGTRYRANGVSQWTQIIPDDNGTNINTYTNIFHLVGQKGVQLRVVVIMHMTVNKDGQIAAYVDKSETTCE